VTVGSDLTEELPVLDGVVVATSTSTHPAFALQMARAGVPSLVEKPLALDPTQLTAVADELDDLGTEVMVAFHRRYDPGHQRLRQHVRAGDAGILRAVTATGHDHLALSADYIPGSGGMWLDMLIHDFDVIPWVTGQRVRSVWATGSVLDAPVHAEYGDVDSALAVLVLESGAAATVSGLRRNGAGQDVRLEVFGSLGSFAAGLDTHTPMTSTEPDVDPPGPPYHQFIDRFERAFRAEADAFVRLASGTGRNLTRPRDGLVAIRIAQASAESMRTGRTIDLDETLQPTGLR
jgi:myo-inositol 2-dehydrogenase/D-chiro-inositol 1-dehydrogenase